MILTTARPTHEYRDRVYIRQDIMLKLFEFGELNQSKLLSYCGLNYYKHRAILDGMVSKNLIARSESVAGTRRVIRYKLSEKGREVLHEVLEPYEALFPRDKAVKKAVRDSGLLSKAVRNLQVQGRTTEAIA